MNSRCRFSMWPRPSSEHMTSDPVIMKGLKGMGCAGVWSTSCSSPGTRAHGQASAQQSQLLSVWPSRIPSPQRSVQCQS